MGRTNSHANFLFFFYLLSVASRSAQLSWESKRRSCFSLYSPRWEWQLAWEKSICPSFSIHQGKRFCRRAFSCSLEDNVEVLLSCCFPSCVKDSGMQVKMRTWRKNKFTVPWACQNHWTILPLSLHCRNVHWALYLWSPAGHKHSSAISLFPLEIGCDSFINSQSVSPCLLLALINVLLCRGACNA